MIRVARSERYRRAGKKKRGHYNPTLAHCTAKNITAIISHRRAHLWYAAADICTSYDNTTDNTLTFTVKSAMTDETEFDELESHRQSGIAGILRLLYHIAYTQYQIPCRMQLILKNQILDSSNDPLTMITDPKESRVEFHVVRGPLLLTWHELCEKIPRPAYEMRTNGRAKQIELRNHCYENEICEVDLADDTYDWRLLLRSMPETNHSQVIEPGVVGFTFRLLSLQFDQDPAFEITLAHGDRWHLRFHRDTIEACDLRPIRFINSIAAFTWPP